MIDEVKILLDPVKREEDSKGRRAICSSDIFSWELGLTNKYAEQSVFRSSLQFEDAEDFEKHLKARSDEIRGIISRLTANLAKAPPDVSDLQSQLAKKLAEEKVTIGELEKALADKQQLEESLEAASLRYMVAEKKLDRARSVTVAKLEKQYILGAQRPGADNASGSREEPSATNGVATRGERNPELEETHHKLVAVSEKQKEQLQKLESENASLLNQVTELNIKVGVLSRNTAKLSLTSRHSIPNLATTIMRIRICSSS